MDGIKAVHHSPAQRGQIGGPIEPPHPARSAVVNVNPIEVDEPVMGNRTVSGPVDAGRQHMDIVSRSHQAAA